MTEPIAAEAGSPFKEKHSISERKRDANRRNAQRSTGPRTQRGKDTSRLNSLKHGMLVRAIPLLNFPLNDSEQKEDLERLLDDLYFDLLPQGRVEEMLVERIACIYFQLSRLYRFQGAAARIAVHREMTTATVELGSGIERIRCAEEEREKLVNTVKRAKQALSSDRSISAELMKQVDACIYSEALRYSLQATCEKTNKLASSGEDIKDKEVQINRLKAAFLSELSFGMRDTSECIKRTQQWSDELARARFGQYLLPDEDVLRKVLRYESMLDRELHRCLIGSIACSSGVEQIDLAVLGPGNGQILDGNDLLNT